MTTVYRPTREAVTVERVTNRGQYRPGGPGAGDRLYAVRGVEGGQTWQATAGELFTREAPGAPGKAWTEPPGLPGA